MGSAPASSAAVSTEAGAAASTPETIEIGARMRCEWRDGELRDCEVLELRQSSGGAPQYYVHYIDFNRRLDEWVQAERLHPHPSTARSSGERKRKLDPAVANNPVVPTHNPHDEAAAGELDAATQREHEAATRVKNINTIVLGKWEIQTWCVRLDRGSCTPATLVSLLHGSTVVSLTGPLTPPLTLAIPPSREQPVRCRSSTYTRAHAYGHVHVHVRVRMHAPRWPPRARGQVLFAVSE